MAYPDSLTEKIPWHSTFNQACNDFSETFPTILDVGTLAKVLANKNHVATLINGADAAKNFGQEVVEYRNIWIDADPGTAAPAEPVPPAALAVPANAVVGIDAYTRSLIAQLDAHPSMTDAIRAAMGTLPATGALGQVRIVSGEPLADSQVGLRFGMAGHEAVAVYLRRANVTTRLGVSTTAAYTDTTGPLVAGQSESREYWIRGIVDNVEQGPISATVLVATTP